MVDIVNSLPNTSHLSPVRMPTEVPGSPGLVSLSPRTLDTVPRSASSPPQQNQDMPLLVQQQPMETTSADCNSAASEDGGKPVKRHRRNGRAGAHHGHTVRRRPLNQSTEQRRPRRRQSSSKKVTTTTDFSVSRNGRPMAPYNTTQFIMEQNYLQLGSPRILQHSCSDELERMPVDQEWMSGESSDASVGCRSDDGPSLSSTSPRLSNDNMERGYDQIYDEVINERLTCMTKEDLVKECKELDAKNIKLERVLSVNTKSPDLS